MTRGQGVWEKAAAGVLRQKLEIGFGRDRSQDLQLASLLPWPEWPVCSQGVPAGGGDWDKVLSGRKELKRKICILYWR